MTISAVSTARPSPLEQALQAVDEEATESLAETQREAQNGDPQAIRRLDLLRDEQGAPPPSTAPTSGQTPPPGTYLNVKA